MTLVRIPKAFQASLAHISKMKDDNMTELSMVLESACPSLHPRDFAKRIASKLTWLSEDDVIQLINTLVGLYQALDTNKQSAKEFVEKVCKACENSESAPIKLDSGQREVFTQRLLTLLSFEKSLGVTSKAFDLLTERERILTGTRILTDIRPIFGRLSERPTAAVIIHNLKLTYHQDGECHEFYVALDNADIKQLKEVLERAELKTQNLQALLKTSKVLNIEETYDSQE